MGEYVWLSPLEHKMFEEWTTFLKHCHLGLTEPRLAGPFKILARFYQQLHRHYHTLEHIADCLERYKEIPRDVNIRRPMTVVMALWWHDVIYDPRSSTNELDSAHLAEDICRMMGIDSGPSARVCEFILATRHESEPDCQGAKFVCDIDLASLGYDWDTFSENSRKIRAEYDFVPEAEFCSKRAEVMRAFLDRPTIYWTEYFRDQYEARARENILRHIEELQQ